MAFDEASSVSNGELKPALVVRLFKNVTTEWLKLNPDGEDTTAPAVFVTPGHLFLNELGNFEQIESIVTRGGMIVREDGSLARVTAERLVYSEATAHLFEEVEIIRHASAAGNALAPSVERGWATYNFEVAKHHTYLANGWRVHNDSQFYIDTAGAIGQAFGTQLGQLLAEGESQFTQLAAGTVLGVVTRNLAEVIADTGLHFNGANFSFDTSANGAFRELTDINVDFASAAAGTASSFLIAELGEALGLEGFGADLFNVSVGSYA